MREERIEVRRYKEIQERGKDKGLFNGQSQRRLKKRVVGEQ